MAKTEEKIVSISKEEALAVLLKAGYNARNENGVIMVYYKNMEEYKDLSDSIRTFLHDHNYFCSFGIKSATGMANTQLLDN